MGNHVYLSVNLAKTTRMEHISSISYVTTNWGNRPILVFFSPIYSIDASKGISLHAAASANIGKQVGKSFAHTIKLIPFSSLATTPIQAEFLFKAASTFNLIVLVGGFYQLIASVAVIEPLCPDIYPNSLNLISSKLMTDWMLTLLPLWNIWFLKFLIASKSRPFSSYSVLALA